MADGTTADQTSHRTGEFDGPERHGRYHEERD
jgi:hypothetical protein